MVVKTFLNVCGGIFDRLRAISLYTRVEIYIIIGAAFMRLMLLLLGWPPMDSDQGTMGIAAIHIFRGTDFPIFFYGQSYMGTLEAYIAAGLFHICGISVFSLRIGLLPFYIGFLINSFLIIKRLFSSKFAIFILVLESLGANDIVFQEISAHGGYPEIFFFVTLLWLIALELVLPTSSLVGQHRFWKRFFLYGLFVLVAGFSIYDDPLIMPFVFFAAFTILLYCYKDFSIPLMLFISAMFLFGLLPWIFYLVAHFQMPARILFNLYRIGHFTISFIQSAQTLLISIPIQLSGNGLCPTPVIDGLDPKVYPAWASGVTSRINSPAIMGIDALNPNFYPGWANGITSSTYYSTSMSRLGVYGSPALLNGIALVPHSSSYIYACISIHAIYGMLITGLFLVTLCIYCIKILSAMRYHKVFSQESRKTLLQIIPILSMAMITLVFMSNTVASFYNPWFASRYFVGFNFALPSMLWILWNNIAKHRQKYFKFANVLRSGLLGIIILAYNAGFISILFQIPEVREIQQQQLNMIKVFEQKHISHIYSEYWTCDRIAFQSQEHVTCMVLWYNLKTGQNSYLPYIAAVQSDPRAAYVFPVSSPQSSLLLGDVHFLRKGYVHKVLYGYDVFLKK